MRYTLKIFVLIWLATAMYLDVSGQQNKIYSEMTLEELLDIDIVVTASKQPEDLFEAPLSVSIIKKEEIEKSGVMSIPEALRLSQGLIVREITPGNYDVHIRGLDDITKNAYVSLPFNTTILVMIDYRIVYSYFSGGTFWETLPIDLNDVERIEIVRGPASALYGPNAVTGVINIITSHANKQGMNINAKGSLGNEQLQKANINIGYNWGDKTKLSFTGNFDERQRFKAEYFDYAKVSYSSIEDLTVNLYTVKDETTNEIWNYQDYKEALGASYHPNISLRKLGGNVFFSHYFSELASLDVAVGAQKSQSIKTGFVNFATSLSQTNSKSYYMNTRLKYKNLNGQFNFHTGEDLNNYSFNSYKFTTADVNVEYYKQFKTLSIRPGLNYHLASYDSPMTYDEPFSLSTLNYQFKNEPRIISSYALSFLSEWKPNSKIRLIGAARIDKFSINKNYSINYEFASTYRLNKKNLLRYTFSSATRSPFIFDTYLNGAFKAIVNFLPIENETAIDVPIELRLQGGTDLKFPTILSNEVSWRVKINQFLSFDSEVFFSLTKNLVVSDAYRDGTMTQELNENGEIENISSIYGSADIVYENFDIKARQMGISFMLNYSSKNIIAKVFGTLQQTTLLGETEIDYKLLNLNLTELPETNQRLVNAQTFANPTPWTDKLTPAFYGGFFINYNTNKKWSFGTDAYFYTNQRFVHYDFNNIMSDYTGKYNNGFMDIKSNLILNAKIDYRINKKMLSFITAKNILGMHREFGYADQIGSQFIIGVKWEL